MLWCLVWLHVPAAADVPRAVGQDATAYQNACGDCHSSPAALARKIRGEIREEKNAYLTELLAHHHTPDPAAIDQIVEYLLALPKK